MKTKSKIALILYILAALLGVVFIVMIISSISQIHEYTASYGISMSEMGGEAFSFILSNSINYLIYGVLVFAAARVLDVVESIKTAQVNAGAAPAAATIGAAATAAAAATAPLTEVMDQAADKAAALVPEEDAAPAKGAVPPLYTSRSFFRY